MRERADLYVGFIERALRLLAPSGTLSFICADRWMRNQYGADLREVITSTFAVDAVISMHDVDAFEDEVAAYPAIVVLRNAAQRTPVVVEAGRGFGASDASRLTTWIRTGDEAMRTTDTFEAARICGWPGGRDLWPAGSPARLALLADLEARFPPLQDERTGTRVGIGVATGCDDVLITDDPELVEPERLLPLLRAADVASGAVAWSGRFLVNPWEGRALVDLERFPRLAAYLSEHDERLRARHVARRRPATWFRTIDRVDPRLLRRDKIVLPDLKSAAHPVLDVGGHYPHHNLYYVVSDKWDLDVLGGLLLSDVANLFVGAYCVRMRGGTYRFQAQYLRRIRVPEVGAVTGEPARELTMAFHARDRERANRAAEELYGLHPGQLSGIGPA
jgi:hypothetical protein